MEVLTQDEELKLLEIKLNQLKLDYEKYFIGTRPTEPAQLRSEVQKVVIKFANTRLTNSALRFKFNSLNGRYQAFKRQWDTILRQIEAGTYKRHVFKANLHDRERGVGADATSPAPTSPASAGAGAAAAGAGTAGAGGKGGGRGSGDLFETYRAAMQAAGQDTSSLSRAKLESVLARQASELKKKLGCEKVSFKVVVQGGKVKLKAAAG
ncbi:MAG: MXAN_5187 C-terminal domain-containing protein [Myxococcota bacterium]